MKFRLVVQTQEPPPVALVTLAKAIGRFANGKIIAMGKSSSEKETALSKRLQRIKEEVKHYPTPIAGCDEQFNFLLSERKRLTLELTRIRLSREK